MRTFATPSLIVFICLGSTTVHAAPSARIHPIDVRASSFLKSNWNKYEENYHPYYVADDDPKTAWVEGKSDAGVGETITLRFAPIFDAKSLRIVIVNGYQKSAKLLEQNAAPKAIALHVEGPKGASADSTLTFASRAMGPQAFDVPLKAGLESVTLKLADIFAGTKWQDTCISDVQVFVDGTVDVATQTRTKAALDTWRSERVSRARQMSSVLAASGFAADRFSRAADAPATECKMSEGLLGTLTSFVTSGVEPGGGGSGYVSSPKSSFVPDGVPKPGELFVTRLPPSTKPLKGKGRVRDTPDCGACSDDAWIERIGLYVERDARGAPVRAFTGFHSSGVAEEISGARSSGTAFAFDGQGRTTEIVEWAEYCEPGCAETYRSRSRMALVWNAKGVIDRVVYFDAEEDECAAYVPAAPE